MPPSHISGTSRALYRVFILPNLRTTTSIPLLYAPAFAPSTPTSIATPSLTPRTTIRTKKYTKDTRRHALTDYYVIDTAIEADTINLVDSEGKFHNDVPITEALASFNKTTHHLLQVTPGKVDELGRIDPHNLPTCRVISKMDLRAQHEKKLDTLRRQAKGQGAGAAPKNLELNWAIAKGDLSHRLQSLKKFLVWGKKVEVLFGPKKKGKQARPEEAEGVLKAVRDAVAECKGSYEVKSEGEVGGIMTVIFQGKKVDTKEEKKGGKEAQMEEEDA